MSGGRDMDFDEEILRPILESVSLCQLVSHEWERVDGALITAALRMNRTLYKWSGALRLQRWNNNTSQFDAVDEMMPVELMEWFRELEEQSLLLIEDGHLLLDPNNAERAFIIWWLREMARMPKHQKNAWCSEASIRLFQLSWTRKCRCCSFLYCDAKPSELFLIMLYQNPISSRIKLRRAKPFLMLHWV